MLLRENKTSPPIHKLKASIPAAYQLQTQLVTLIERQRQREREREREIGIEIEIKVGR